ncbi:MAG TPA: sugar ABC transporter permease [Propionibacteriaceae bacterium]|nr:sugar ABC transporter permease [Propionibacteriaceae bacterium]
MQKEAYNRRETVAGLLFISPWIVGFLVFTAGAMLYSLYLSFTNYDISTNLANPVGTANYQRMFEDPKVVTSLSNTLFYAIMAVPLETCFALFLAAQLNKVGRGAGFFRVAYYLPKMTPSVAAASVFLLLLNGNFGAINRGLAAIGIRGPQWLLDPQWVKPSIVLMALWSVSGTMVILLAALKRVPIEMYESADVDGAPKVRQFFHITVPMISGQLFFVVIVQTIAALQVFDQAYLLFYRDTTSTAPDAALFYGVYLFQQAFQQFNMGFAAALAWLLFVIVLIISVIQIKVGDRLVFYEGNR